MENKYTAVIKKDDDWWIGWVEEIPGVNCQGKTKEELLDTLRVTLKEALEMNNRGIPLTQVPPIYSITGHGRLPPHTC